MITIYEMFVCVVFCCPRGLARSVFKQDSKVCSATASSYGVTQRVNAESEIYMLNLNSYRDYGTVCRDVVPGKPWWNVHVSGGIFRGQRWSTNWKIQCTTQPAIPLCALASYGV